MSNPKAPTLMAYVPAFLVLLTVLLSRICIASACVANQVPVDDECWCAAGYYCVSNDPPAACPAGYTSNLGATSLNQCYVAQGVVLNLTVDYVSMNRTQKAFIRALPNSSGLISYDDKLMVYVANCPTGYWCPEATGMPVACVAGTYQPNLAAESIAACLPCPVGHFCAAATTTPSNCTAGTYRNTTGAPPGGCDICPAGGYCPVGVSAVTPTPAGTYISQTGRSSLQDAVQCPAGYFCGEGATHPTPCAPGTFRSASSGTSQSFCSECPAGFYCPAHSVAPTACVAGTHRDTPGATQQVDCELCMPGTYSMEENRTSVCPACPIASYCPTSTSISHCPDHTTSTSGSYSVAACVCDAGYDCAMQKEIRATIRVNVTYSSFADDEGGVRTSFIAAVAAAANVTVDNVIINSISEARRLRRLLSHYATVVAHSKDPARDSLRMQAALKQAIHLKNLRKRSEAKSALHAPHPPPKQLGRSTPHSSSHNRFKKHGV